MMVCKSLLTIYNNGEIMTTLAGKSEGCYNSEWCHVGEPQNPFFFDQNIHMYVHVYWTLGYKSHVLLTYLLRTLFLHLSSSICMMVWTLFRSFFAALISAFNCTCIIYVCNMYACMGVDNMVNNIQIPQGHIFLQGENFYQFLNFFILQTFDLSYNVHVILHRRYIEGTCTCTCMTTLQHFQTYFCKCKVS